VIVSGTARRTLEEAGGAYVDHLEHVMERKRSTVQDYRGHLRRHLVPFFGERPIDKIEPVQVAQYLKRKRSYGLSSKTVQSRELEDLRRRSRFSADRDLVFCHPDTGHVLDPSKMRKRFKDALAEAGVHEITFHELRYTFGTQMAAAGAPLRTIQEWMGHVDAKTTEIYRHYAPDPSNGAAFVERAFGGGAHAHSDAA
jgi:site-specific recombinase XerD